MRAWGQFLSLSASLRPVFFLSLLLPSWLLSAQLFSIPLLQDSLACSTTPLDVLFSCVSLSSMCLFLILRKLGERFYFPLSFSPSSSAFIFSLLLSCHIFRLVFTIQVLKGVPRLGLSWYRVKYNVQGLKAS